MTASPSSSRSTSTSQVSDSSLPYSMQAPIGISQLPAGPSGCNTLIGCFNHLSLNSNNKSRFPAPPKPAASPIGTRDEQRKIYHGPKLSDRATGGPDAGPLIERFSCLFKDQYHCKSNPKGIVSLGVAENFLLQDECLEYFKTAFAKNFLTSDLSYGDSLWGSRRINRALSSFLNDYFHPAEPLTSDSLITGVGCSAVLDQLFYTLMDEGDSVLLIGPYYTGFDRDLIGRARVNLVPVCPPCEGFSPESLRYFEEKMDELTASGHRVRAVIVCNPHNPIGRTYTRETLLAYAKFCEERDLHLVSDEIYAMSVYQSPQSDNVPFTSMLSLDPEKELGIAFDKARLHVVYGMSKDFCANGLRVGALISPHNPLLLRAMANTSMLMKISSPADVIWSTLLEDRPTLERFLATNRSRLAEAAAHTRKFFEQRGVEVYPSNAGNFAWVNLGPILGIETADEEKRIFQKLLDGGVYVAPGSGYHNPTPGWYRITFSVARDNLDVGLRKMEDILGLRKIANGNGNGHA